MAYIVMAYLMGRRHRTHPTHVDACAHAHGCVRMHVLVCTRTTPDDISVFDPRRHLSFRPQTTFQFSPQTTFQFSTFLFSTPDDISVFNPRRHFSFRPQTIFQFSTPDDISVFGKLRPKCARLRSRQCCPVWSTFFSLENSIN